MRPNKNRKPFTLYKKETQTGPVWYVRFWDETTRRYAVTRSTGIPVEGKKQHRYEAEQAAREMLPNIQFTPVAPGKSFIQYISDFWLPDSVYVTERAFVKKQRLFNELRAIGIQEGEQKRRNLTFHGLRHTFVILGRLAGITDLEIAVSDDESGRARAQIIAL